MAIDDGGPAFPVPTHRMDDGLTVVLAEHDGMSLRDWFAGQALAGYIADPAVRFDAEGKTVLVAAKHCWQMADAMIAARQKE